MENRKWVDIISDSHDNMLAIRAAVELFYNKQVGLVIHAGGLVVLLLRRKSKNLTIPLKLFWETVTVSFLDSITSTKAMSHISPYRLKIGNLFYPASLKNNLW